MPTRVTSLRKTLTVVTVLLTLLVTLVSGALIVLTRLLQGTTESVASAVESVRLSEEAEIDLLMHARGGDSPIGRSFEADIRRRLLEAESYVTTDEEAKILADATRLTEVYLEASQQGSSAEIARAQDEAYERLEALVAINIEQAASISRDARAWEKIGTTLGIVSGLFVLLSVGGLLAWLNGRAFQPVFELAAAMHRVAQGELEARAEEKGSAELIEMSRQFNVMAASLGAQRQAQMAFLGGVAHDLRNPLMALKMSVGMVLNKTPSDPRTRRALELINRQVARMERMTGDFLDMAKIEAGELELRPELVDARQLVMGLLDLFEGTSPQHELDVCVPSEATFAHCDPMRVEQVLINLVSNAIKYSPDGGVVHLRMTSNAETLTLEVTDSGVGISSENQLNMFEPFRRVGSLQGAIPGVGLGLFVVRRIVRGHGGNIEVDSTLGQGTTFRVFLPRNLNGDRACFDQREDARFVETEI